MKKAIVIIVLVLMSVSLSAQEWSGKTVKTSMSTSLIQDRTVREFNSPSQSVDFIYEFFENGTGIFLRGDGEQIPFIWEYSEESYITDTVSIFTPHYIVTRSAGSTALVLGNNNTVIEVFLDSGNIVMFSTYEIID
jgi:hypothetical protein